MALNAKGIKSVTIASPFVRVAVGLHPSQDGDLKTALERIGIDFTRSFTILLAFRIGFSDRVHPWLKI